MNLAMRKVRPTTIPPRHLTKAELEAARRHPSPDVERPRSRADCLAGGCNEERPCPWVSCRYHLFLEVNPETGSLKLVFPDCEPWDLEETCTLDVADRGGVTLEEVGEILNLTRERIRQVEVRGLLRLKRLIPPRGRRWRTAVITLRPYQQQAVDAVFRELVERMQRSTLLVAAVGTGKTIMFSAVAERWRARGRVLVLAHREELLDQAEDKIRSSTGLSTGIEQADRAVRRDRLPDVTIASVQTMRGARLQAFAPDAFSLIIIDEAHHTAAESYGAILDRFPARVLGVTATPTRTDGQSLSLVFKSVAFEYRIRRAIADGYLVPLRRRRCQIAGLDLSAVRGVRDFTDEDLAAALSADPIVREVARQIVTAAGQRLTMVFGPTVAYTQKLAAAINAIARPGAALAVDGTAAPEVRAAALEAFRARRHQYLLNCALWTEGFDLPAIECVAVVRPTKSPGLFEQMVGRGTRLSTETGKRDLLVLEIGGRVKAGQRLVTSTDILGYDETSKVRSRAGQLLDRDPALTVSAALDRAHNEGVAKPPATGPVTTPAQVARGGRDGLALALDLRFIVLVEPTPGAQPANSVQRGELAQAGIDRPGLDVRQAQMLLEGLRRRKAAGLCSPKQAAVLRRFGLPSDVSAREAGRQMAKLFGTGGRHAASSGGGGRFATPTLRGIR